MSIGVVRCGMFAHLRELGLNELFMVGNNQLLVHFALHRSCPSQRNICVAPFFVLPDRWKKNEALQEGLVSQEQNGRFT